MMAMDAQHPQLTIGELAKRTGLSVKTIRFYSDTGLVPPTTRTPAGYRLYDTEAAARLDLVCTLRDLGIDLATIRTVLDRKSDLGQVAAAHADALDAHIRLLRMRRSVLRTITDRDHAERDITLMNKLARLSAEERQAIIDDYHDHVFRGLDLDRDFMAKIRSVRVDLPDDPTPHQVDAWVELAELVHDPAFRQRVRAMAEGQAQERTNGTYQPPTQTHVDAHTRITEVARRALEAGVDPASPHARELVDTTMPTLTHAFGGTDTPTRRQELADRFATGADTRVERYWHLVGIINGHPPAEPEVPLWEWFIAALRASARG